MGTLAQHNFVMRRLGIAAGDTRPNCVTDVEVARAIAKVRGRHGLVQLG
jgi:hypothetical protein